MEEIEKFHFFVKTNSVSTKASEKLTWVILCLYLQRLPFRIENTAGFLCEEDILKTKGQRAANLRKFLENNEQQNLITDALETFRKQRKT